MIPHEERDKTNYKPFRTKELRALAKKTARKCDDGAYRWDAPVSNKGNPTQRKRP